MTMPAASRIIHHENEINAATEHAHRLIAHALNHAALAIADTVRRQHSEATGYLLNRACPGESYPFELNWGTVLLGGDVAEADPDIVDALYPLLTPAFLTFRHNLCAAMTTNGDADLVVDFAAAYRLPTDPIATI